MFSLIIIKFLSFFCPAGSIWLGPREVRFKVSLFTIGVKTPKPWCSKTSVEMGVVAHARPSSGKAKAGRLCVGGLREVLSEILSRRG